MLRFSPKEQYTFWSRTSKWRHASSSTFFFILKNLSYSNFNLRFFCYCSITCKIKHSVKYNPSVNRFIFISLTFSPLYIHQSLLSVEGIICWQLERERVRVSKCVCVRERDRDRDNDTKRETDRRRYRERNRQTKQENRRKIKRMQTDRQTKMSVCEKDSGLREREREIKL